MIQENNDRKGAAHDRKRIIRNSGNYEVSTVRQTWNTRKEFDMFRASDAEELMKNLQIFKPTF